MTPEVRAAIEQTIQTYFDGLYEGDADKLASVFHPGSALTYDNAGCAPPAASRPAATR